MSFLACAPFKDFVTNLSKLWWFIRKWKNTYVAERVLMAAFKETLNFNCVTNRNKAKVYKKAKAKDMINDYMMQLNKW